MDRLRFEQVVSFERLHALEEPWRRLWARAPAATPFSSPAWLLPWCRHLARHPPRCTAVWRGDELAALAPTFVYQDGEERVLGLLGGGVSDYQDVLAEDLASAAALLDRLLASGASFDLCRLEALPPESRLLAAAALPGAAVSTQDVCPVLALPARFEGLAGVASSKLLADVRRQRRNAARAGRLEVVHAPPSDPRPLLEELHRLHAERWRARGEPGVLAADALLRFHRDALPGLAAGGLLRMTALRLDGRTFAAVYALAARARWYAYLQGIDPGAARLSPGTLAVAAVIEHAIAEGARELDLLRGDEPYKYRWGAVDRPSFRLEVRTASAAAGWRPASPAPA